MKQTLQQDVKIGMREFIRNPKKYFDAVKRGMTFVVQVRGENRAKIVMPSETSSGKQGMKKLLAIRAKSDERDMSKNIDKIVYGQ